MCWKMCIRDRIEIVQTKDVNDAREKISMTYLSGAMDDLPTATMIDPVSLIDLAKGGIVMDVTDDISPQVPNMVCLLYTSRCV